MEKFPEVTLKKVLEKYIHGGMLRGTSEGISVCNSTGISRKKKPAGNAGISES